VSLGLRVSAFFLVSAFAAVLWGCGAPDARELAPARAELRGDSELIAHFQHAEKESGVPAEVLATIAYVQTRLSMNLAAGLDEHEDDGHAHTAREYGLMAIGTGGLTDVDAAALMVGLPKTDVATQPLPNIRAAAALLRSAGHARGISRGDDVLSWAGVVEAYGGEVRVREVVALIRGGWSGTDDEGFKVEVVGIGDGLSDDEIGVVAQALGYPGAIWSPAYSGNYTNSSRGASQINYVIIHTTQGSYAGAISWFKNSSSKVSSHYVIRSSDGQVTQMVDDADIAWHDACFNSQTIGIEHEGYVADPGKWYTEAMYKSSAKLTAWLCNQYGIPKDKAHIMGHGEAPDCSTHTDPGSGWNWSHYMDLVKNNGCAPKTEVCNGKDDDCDGKVDEGGVCNQKPKGYLDGVTCESVKGWSQDPDAPTKSIDVHVYFGGPAGSGAKGASFSASVKRDDLCKAIGSCNHGFDIEPPLSLLDGQDHAIHAYGIDTAGGPNAQLTGSPKTLKCAATVPDGVRRHVQNMDSFGAWKLDLFWDALPLSDAQIAKIDEADAWPAKPKLVKADDGSPEVWLVDGKWRRHVPSQKVLAAWGWSNADVKTMAAADVQALWEGTKLRGRPMLVKDSTGAIDMLDDRMPEPTAVHSPTPEESGWGGAGGAGGPSSSGGSAAQQASSDKGSTAEPMDGSCACRQAAPSRGRAPTWALLAFVALPLLRRRR